MTPALKTDDTARLTGAVEVLKASGVASAEIKGNAISVTAAEVNIAANVLDAAFQHGMITVKPMLTSPEAIEMPVASNPALSVAKEEVEEVAEVVAPKEDQTPEAKVKEGGEIKIEPRTLRNRMENQIKKVDEEVEQIDELSTDKLKQVASVAREKGRASTLKAAIKAGQRKRSQPDYKFAGEEVKTEETPVVEEVLTELSYTKLKRYEKKGTSQVADAAKNNKLDSRMAKRASYVAKAKQKSTVKLKKAAFGEEASPVQKLVSLCEALKIRETLHSESGDHHAKIYRDTEFGEHRVKYFPHGKHHEPADSFHSDHDDAHHTAKQELRRMDKFSGALKESTEEQIKTLQEDKQLDELSKATLGRYIKKASNDQAATSFVGGALEHQKSVARLLGHDLKKTPGALAHEKKLERSSVNRHRGINRATDKLTKEEAEEGTLPFQDEQLDEVSSNTLKRYIKKSGANRDHHLKMDGIYTNAARKASDHDAKSGSYKHAHQHSDKAFNRDVGIDRAKEKLKSRKVSEEVEQLDEIVKVGTYTNKFGHTLTMHRSPNDNKHHMLVHDGSVVKTHHGSAEDFHKKLTKDGFQGALHEEVEQLDELSPGTLTRYAIKASSDKKVHVARATASFSRGNAEKGEPEVKAKMHKDAQKHSLKAINRHEGIKKAADKMAKKCETAGVCEEINLTEANADAEKAKKTLFKHPEADAIGKTMMGATKHFNYVQDAVDHVYNNHSKDLSYEDFDKIRPHLEDHFKKNGLK
jgi:hypothetical protein